MRVTMLIAAVMLLSACGQEPAKVDPDKTFLSTQTEALEAARDLEDAALESKDRLDESLKKSGG